MTRFRKTIAASLAALTIGGSVLATSATPAAAWGGYGWGGWHGGWHRGWGGPGIAAGVIGGLALGAAAASAAPYYGYGYGGGGCVANQPYYDGWGYVHYRRVIVPC